MLRSITFRCFLFGILCLYCHCFVRRHDCYHSHKYKHNRHSYFVHQASATPDDNGLSKIRLNKVFKATHSRREADSLIASGRVTVNNIPVTSKGGLLVQPYEDIVYLDGKLVKGWEVLNSITPVGGRSSPSPNSDIVEVASQSVFQYIKYWKPIGTVCTTDQKIPGNIIDQLKVDGFEPENRIYPVGRLDKDTTGLLVLTNDGRVPNSFLRSKHRKSKIYEVVVDRSIKDDDIEKLKVSEFHPPSFLPIFMMILIRMDWNRMVLKYIQRQSETESSVL